MFAGAAVGKVVDDGAQVGKLDGAVRPQIGTMCFTLAWGKHVYRCFVGMQDVLPQHFFAQCIDQRPQLHAAHADPGPQRGTRNRQAGTSKDALLQIQG